MLICIRLSKPKYIHCLDDSKTYRSFNSADFKLNDVEGGVTLANRVDNLVAILIHSTEQNLRELLDS